MTWCIQAKDAVFAAFLAEKSVQPHSVPLAYSTPCSVLVSCVFRYFASYQRLGEFMDLDLLDHLGSAMMLSDKLTFLGQCIVVGAV